MRAARSLELASWTVAGLLSLSPVAWLLAASFIRDGRASLALYGALSDARSVMLLGRSIALAALATLFAHVLGGALACLFAVRRFPAARWMRATVFLPLVLPPFAQVLVWEDIFRPGGALAGALGIASGLPFRQSLPACALLMAISFSPIAFFFASSGLRSVPAELADAARLAGGPWLQWTRVLLPLAAPSLAVGGVLVFVLALLHFEIPDLLELPTYAVEVQLEHDAGGAGAAFVFALPVCVAALAALLPAWWWASRRGFAIRGGIGRLPHPARQAGWRAWTVLAAWWALAVGLPAGLLATRVGGLEVARAAFVSSWEHITGGSLLPLLSAACATLLAGLVARPRPLRAIELVLWLPFVLPGALLSFAVIRIWNRPALAWVYDSPLLLVTGEVARYFPLAYFTLRASLTAVPVEHWEAGRLVAGGVRGRLAVLRRVYLPLAAPGLVLGAAMCFVLASGELPLALQLQDPGMAPVTVHIYNMLHAYRDREVAAWILYHSAVVLAIAALVLALGREREGRG